VALRAWWQSAGHEPGQRSGAWQKMRVNRAQAFVIAGYTPGARGFDAVVFGYCAVGKLMYAGRTRNGFTPSSCEQLFKRFAPLAVDTCPFANLLEAKGGRWGEGLTAEKMKECRWLKPSLVARSSSLNGRRTPTCVTRGLLAARRQETAGDGSTDVNRWAVVQLITSPAHECPVRLAQN